MLKVSVTMRCIYIGCLLMFVGCGGLEEQATLDDVSSDGPVDVTQARSDGADSGQQEIVEALANEAIPEETTVFCQTQFTAFQTLFIAVIGDCAGCHRSGGLAGSTQFVIPNVGDQLEWLRFLSLQQFLEVDGHGERMLAKARGQSHGGGLQLLENSSGYEALDQYIADNVGSNCDAVEVVDESTTLSVSDLPMLQSIVLDQGAILRRASVLFGRPLPSADEIEAVFALTEPDFKNRLKAEMIDDGFSDFVMTAANNQLLTNKWLNSDILSLYREQDFAAGFQWIDSIRENEGGQASAYVRRRVGQAIAQAPLRLFEYIAQHDNPYTDILTSPFTMVNVWSDQFYQAGAFTQMEIDAGLSDSIFRPGSITTYKIQNLPDAGLLTTTSYLARYPSTSTNRNRARSKWTHLFFLGEDIEALADRPMSSDALSDTDNPTLNNPACAQCHETLDPIAGAFQNWSDNGVYRRYDIHSLPRSYTRSSAYEQGDLWYRDMRTPGFRGQTLPVEQGDQSVSWLAQQIINHDSFAEGAVRFWLPAFLGRELSARPSEGANSVQQALTYEAELELIQRAAAFFESSQGKSPWILRDLFAELLLSPLVSHSVSPTTFADDSPVIAEVSAQFGQGRLLTPEELHRKVVRVTGFPWKKDWQDFSEFHERYLTLAGSIDSDGITERLEQLNTIASQVPKRMALEMSCFVVSETFEQASGQRLMLETVALDDTGVDAVSEARIRQDIIALMHSFWGQFVIDPQDPEVTAIFQLFRSIIESREQRNATPWLANNDETCYLDWSADSVLSHDEFHTMRAWAAVLVYMMTDLLFLIDR